MTGKDPNGQASSRVGAATRTEVGRWRSTRKQERERAQKSECRYAKVEEEETTEKNLQKEIEQPGETVQKEQVGDMQLLELSGDMKGEWYDHMDVVVDTGACASALPEDWYVDYPLLPAKGRTTFRAANGGTMVSKGNRKVSVTLEDGKNAYMNFTVLPVKRALASVSAMVKAGCKLVFDSEEKGGSYVIDRDGHKNRLVERGGVYVLSTWVRGFHGQA